MNSYVYICPLITGIVKKIPYEEITHMIRKLPKDGSMLCYSMLFIFYELIASNIWKLKL